MNIKIYKYYNKYYNIYFTRIKTKFVLYIMKNKIFQVLSYILIQQYKYILKY